VLTSRGMEKRYIAGQELFRAGDAARGLFIVRSGRVRVTRRRAGRGQVVHVEDAGGTLGEIPLFTAAPYPATATATEPTRCLVFTRDTVRDAMAADPEFALRLLGRLSDRVRGLIARLDRLSFASVRARLASFIIDRAARSSGAVISLGLTQTQLAEELGTVREVVVKELAALRRAGAIVPRGAGRVVVADASVLAQAAKGGPRPAPAGGARLAPAGGASPAPTARAPSRLRARAPGDAARGARPPSAGR
jgi:CRP-like cAMP-binding protein